MSKPSLALAGIRRAFRQGGRVLEVLRGLDLAIAAGEVVALVGPSGSGKSTLLHVAGLLERPDAGSIRVAGEELAAANDALRTRTRRDRLGFVYQFHHLLPEFSALENVAMPRRIAGCERAEAEARARELLGLLGLAERLNHRPAQLSGGEQQRVAIARALANRPALLLADEPTGNLDQATGGAVFQELLALSRQTGLAALIATHNAELAKRCDRVVRLEQGILRADAGMPA
ncbi:MAG: ABC transporter ATP-binding protein [Alphaproteobacteria bacterium]|nr:ABC transporter ATP-binding protein [Alphaproteobacteria bacterium]